MAIHGQSAVLCCFWLPHHPTPCTFPTTQHTCLSLPSPHTFQEALELRPHGDLILEGGSDDDDGLDRAATLTRDDSLLHNAHWGPSGQAALLQSSASDDAVTGLAIAGVPAVAVHKVGAGKCGGVGGVAGGGKVWVRRRTTWTINTHRDWCLSEI